MAMTNATKAIQMMKDGKNKDEIMNDLNMTETSYNTYRSSYIQMYMEDGKMTDKLRECFDGFNEGMSVPEVIKATGYGKNFTFNAYNEWLLINERQKSKEDRKSPEEIKKSIKEANKKAANIKETEVLSTDEFTEKFFEDMQKEEAGQGDSKEKIAAANEVSETGERVEEARTSQSKEEQEASTDASVEEKTVEHGVAPEAASKGMELNEKFEEAVKDMEASIRKPKLKKVVKLVEIQGEFTTYKPIMENSFEMEVDGQVITLSREQMKDFGEELLAVAEEEI